jgi:RND family efflux transporter MFP subunit
MNTEDQLRREVEELKRLLQQRDQEHAGLPTERWKPSGLFVSVLVLMLIVALVAAFFAGYTPLTKREATVRAESAERAQALPTVEVMQLARATAQNDLQLPGTLQAITEAPILARADGYLKKRYVDIGDRVTAGQPLAEIDAPELDLQFLQAQAAVDQAQAAIEQAQANLEQGRANRDLAKVTADRWKALAAQGVVSQQENDQYQAQLGAQNASIQALEKAIAAQRSNLAAAKANVLRLEQVKGYRTVVAPFAGVVTQRNVDTGALVSTGNTLLFRIAQTGSLRTYVNIPQSNANSIHVGQQAVLTFTNFPGREFSGAVARTSNSLDPSTRTMLVEVDLANPTGTLFPGMYAQVDLRSKRENPPLTAPASAVIARSDGAQVAIVQDGVVHLQKITVGRDYGDRIEILQGVPEGATLVTSPNDVIREGARIIPVPRAAEAN